MLQSSVKLTYLGSKILLLESLLSLIVPKAFCPSQVHMIPPLYLSLTPNQKKVRCFLCFPFIFFWLGFLLSPCFVLFFPNLDSLKYKWKLMVLSKLSNILHSFAQNNCLFLFISSQCLKSNNTSSLLNL